MIKNGLNKKRITKEGKIYVFFQKEKGGEIYYQYSEDDERTWSETFRLGEIFDVTRQLN